MEHISEAPQDPTEGHEDEPTLLSRFSKWYKNNEDAVIIAAIGASFFGACLIKVVEGKTVKSGDVAIRDDGATLIILRLKNGKRQILLRPAGPPEERPANLMDEIFGPKK